MQFRSQISIVILDWKNWSKFLIWAPEYIRTRKITEIATYWYRENFRFVLLFNSAYYTNDAFPLLNEIDELNSITLSENGKITKSKRKQSSRAYCSTYINQHLEMTIDPDNDTKVSICFVYRVGTMKMASLFSSKTAKLSSYPTTTSFYLSPRSFGASEARRTFLLHILSGFQEYTSRWLSSHTN